MKVLLVTPYYSPDLGPSAPLLSMLCEDLTKLGNQLTIIAAVPHFPSGRVSASYRNKWIDRKYENGSKVIRLWVPGGDRSNLLHRTWVFFLFQVEASLCSLLIDSEKVIITNPCLETWLPFLVALLKRKEILYCVWDVYPEIGIKTNVFRNKFVIDFIRVFENFCLKHAKKIHVFAQEAADQLVNHHYVGIDKIFNLPPWVDTQWLQPQVKKNTLCGIDLVGKFVVLYAGNMGHSQGLTNVLEAAKILQKATNCLFIFLGEGTEKNALVAKAEKEHIENVHFLPYQPREFLPDMLSEADVCLISLRPEVSEESIPSKAFPIMAVGRPILSFTNPESSLWRLVETSQSGINVPGQRFEELADTIIELIDHKELLIKLGENARTFALTHLDRFHAAKVFEAQLSKMQPERTV